MVKKKNRPGPQGNSTVTNRGAGSTAADQPRSAQGGEALRVPSMQTGIGPEASLPAEVTQGGWIVAFLAFMMFLTPAIGVPHEEMLQDTLKSMVVSFSAIGASLVFFWQQRHRREPLRWHVLMWLPLSLMFYALASMLWSHAYLGGVEAIRWFIFSLLLWLGLNTLSKERLPYLALGIHLGAFTASLWTALQFWFDFTYFPQGPNPASTFVNRNFFAEFVVCAMPFSAYLLAQAKTPSQITLMSLTSSFITVALMMTGTRGALVALWVLLLLILPAVAILYRKQFAFHAWRFWQKILACCLMGGTVLALGLIHTGNMQIAREGHGTTAFERAFSRTATISGNDSSLGVRLIMWKATSRMIKATPLTGVGAGAWEVDIPLYQVEGSQLETDYYVHNEILQLLAEYGLVGWAFLAGLLLYLLVAACKTLMNRRAEGLREAPLRAIALSSLLALLIVSNIGFPWRLASTVAIFALALAMLAASDARLGFGLRSLTFAQRLCWKPFYSWVFASAMLLCLVLAGYISQQAAAAEGKIVRAVRLALSVTQSQDYRDPRWNKIKREMLNLINDGIAINPHYRKLTPLVADELARWGDWKNAVWIWESVVQSRPYIVGVMSNVARGYAQMGNNDKAFEFLERCKKLQPKAPSVRSLEVILLGRTGREPEALRLVKQSLAEGIYDYDLLNAAWALGGRSGDYDLAIQGMELRNKGWPALEVDGMLKLGYIYAFQKKDEPRAFAAYQAALAATPERAKNSTLQMIPPTYRPKP
jgi:O-antigen ligase